MTKEQLLSKFAKRLKPAMIRCGMVFNPLLNIFEGNRGSDPIIFQLLITDETIGFTGQKGFKILPILESKSGRKTGNRNSSERQLLPARVFYYFVENDLDYVAGELCKYINLHGIASGIPNQHNLEIIFKRLNVSRSDIFKPVVRFSVSRFFSWLF